jgi:hypothetical protein
MHGQTNVVCLLHVSTYPVYSAADQYNTIGTVKGKYKQLLDTLKCSVLTALMTDRDGPKHVADSN